MDGPTSERQDAVAAKFTDPDWTITRERRASVALTRLRILWINTGTLCNIVCRNCYIESSPSNDRLVYFSARDAAQLYDEILTHDLGTEEIGFTGGEPFLNPELAFMLEDALMRGFSALVLTNGMQPMQRPKIKRALMALKEAYGEKLKLRVSLDHYSKDLHEAERGPRSWEPALAGLDWLARNGFNVAVAGRSCWGESEAETRAGYARFIAARGWPIDAADPSQLTLLPEMDGRSDVPEITTRCWALLHKAPGDVMCATSRMVVKRRGADRPTVVPCTLLPYERAFEMGSTLLEASRADGGMFAAGAVKLCHPNCAKFCVLGGGSCAPTR
jgi:sulfatase maturation enzyme AslB (radical SAM superfamily)